MIDRLGTIMDADKVMVLDDGYLIEYDAPIRLLRDPHSLFSRSAPRLSVRHFEARWCVLKDWSAIRVKEMRRLRYRRFHKFGHDGLENRQELRANVNVFRPVSVCRYMHATT